jgi:hypothetical protein
MSFVADFTDARQSIKRCPSLRPIATMPISAAVIEAQRVKTEWFGNIALDPSELQSRMLSLILSGIVDSLTGLFRPASIHCRGRANLGVRSADF